MFWNRQKPPVRHRRSTDTTLIAAGTTIEGDIVFSGVLEIEGRVNGEVRAAQDGSAVARVLPGGHVNGSVRAPVVVVNGEVSGNVYSTEHIELASAAVIHGDVEYSLIEMTRGAQLSGRLVHRGVTAAATGDSPSREAPDHGSL